MILSSWFLAALALITVREDTYENVTYDNLDSDALIEKCELIGDRKIYVCIEYTFTIGIQRSSTKHVWITHDSHF